MDLTAKELIELTKEIDQKCIDFAEWLRINVYYEYLTKEFMYNKKCCKSEKELLEIYKKEIGL